MGLAHLIASVDGNFSLVATILVKAILVEDPMSLLLLLPFEPCFRGAPFELDVILYVESVFTASELLSSGREQLPLYPLGAWTEATEVLYLHVSRAAVRFNLFQIQLKMKLIFFTLHLENAD